MSAEEEMMGKGYIEVGGPFNKADYLGWQTKVKKEELFMIFVWQKVPSDRQLEALAGFEKLADDLMKIVFYTSNQW